METTEKLTWGECVFAVTLFIVALPIALPLSLIRIYEATRKKMNPEYKTSEELRKEFYLSMSDKEFSEYMKRRRIERRAVNNYRRKHRRF